MQEHPTQPGDRPRFSPLGVPTAAEPNLSPSDRVRAIEASIP